MRIVGVDPALTITGYGVIDFAQGACRLVEAGVVRTDAKESLAKRLAKIHRSLAALIDEVKPDVMILEKIYSHYRHPATSYLLGHARGVACLVSAEKNIPLIEYPATHVKKAISGRGHASKPQVQQMVLNMLSMQGTSPKYLDITDALALAIAHTHTTGSKV